mgnify:CR=1 FL=1
MKRIKKKTVKKEEKIIVSIPQSWKDLSLGTFRNYQLIKKDNKSDLELKMISIEILCGLKADQVRRLHIKDLNKIYKDLMVLLTQQTARFMFKQVFKFKGKRIGFIPNLSKISTGEWADFEELLRNGGYWENAHKVMSILWRPITEEKGKLYSVEEYSEDHIEKADQFLDLGMDKVLAAQSFFLRLGLDLSRILRTSILQEKSEKAQQKLRDLITQSRKNMGGITRSLS